MRSKQAAQEQCQLTRRSSSTLGVLLRVQRLLPSLFELHMPAAALAEAEESNMPNESPAFFESLEVRRTQALVQRDMTTMEELHAPEYELVTPGGTVLSRQAYFERIREKPFYSAWGVSAVEARIGSDMAVVRYKANLQFPSSREILCWHTDVYQRRVGRWQAVWSQATEIDPHTGEPKR